MKVSAGNHILMLLENNPFPQDARVRREAEALVEAGYPVSVIAPQRQGQSWRENVQGVQVYRFPAPPEANGLIGYLLEYGISLLATFILSLVVLFREGFDIIHTHNPPDLFVLIALLYKPFGKRFIFDHHDLSPEMYYARFGGEGNRLVYTMLVLFEKLSCKLADHVISTNESYKKIAMERGKVPAEKITVVRNGPDLNRLKPVEADMTLKRPGKMMLCYVGDMGFHDGVDHLLKALQHLVYDLDRPDFFGILVGGGDAWPSVTALAKELQLDDYVQFTGRVAHTEVARYLSATDICVAPEPSNTYNDRSTMIKITEYMALAKPTVAFDLPEHRVTAQDAAIYAQPNDELDFAQKIALLMDDPEQRQKMGQLGRERIETSLAWQYQKLHLLEAYKTLSLPAEKVMS